MRTNISMSAHVGLSPQNHPEPDPSSFFSRIPANLRTESHHEPSLGMRVGDDGELRAWLYSAEPARA